MGRYNIRISGFGGQGIVLAGFIVGKAASLYDNKNAAFTQSYGPEARGGACSACIVIDEDKISYPLVREADFFIVLSQEGYEKYAHRVTPNALVFVDVDLVNQIRIDNKKIFGIPATRLAKEMGQAIVANIIMLGFFTSIANIISKQAMVESIKTSVKKDFIEINLRAYQVGCEYAGRIQGE
jgi:2-oxoglutarate ferredoxin oxidoreductase subunit gamma